MINQSTYRHYFKVLLVGVLVTCFATFKAEAQDSDLYIYGYNQTIFNAKRIHYTLYPNEQNGLELDGTLDNSFETNSFALHQLNLFLQKQITNETTFFLNVEATGSFSTRYQSGTFNIQEGWINHRFNSMLNLKVGLLLPVYNNLSEIKNRLPLFPYLIRPLVYEDLFEGLFNIENYYPQRAYLQLSGLTSISSDMIFEYALYVGNSEPSYLSNRPPGQGIGTEQASGTLYRGENLTKMLAYGGRIGLSNYEETFKVGLSGSFDHDNRNEPTEESLARLPVQVLPVFGDVPRYRLGVDFSFSAYDFNFESEFMGVYHDHSDIHKISAYRNVNLNKYFGYVMLSYNFNTKHYVFGSYNNLTDKAFDFLLDDSPDGKGLHAVFSGYGFRPTDELTFKAQYTYGIIGENRHLDLELGIVTFGVSLIF